MIQVIVDSGSTKAEWSIIKGDRVTSVTTSGMNPYFIAPDGMNLLIEQNVFPVVEATTVDKVSFYGAGCASVEKRNVVSAVLSSSFPAANVSINTDLLGAARGLFKDDNGLIAILGTGTNTGIYDGNNIIRNVDSLGYLLGDEGSGTSIGKAILRGRLRNEFSSVLNEKFSMFCPLTRDSILDKIYSSPFPNRFLAGFALFASQNITDPYIAAIVKGCFSDFVTNILMRYEEVDKYPISATGSIAYFFRALLQTVCYSHGIRVQNVIQSPMEGLIQYHLDDK